MAKAKKQLLLTIEQSGKVVHHRLAKDRFTIGRHPDNDITVYSEEYPIRHTLFAVRNNHYQLRFKKFMKGEVVAKRSRLTFNDMIVHNLLANRGDSFYYPITKSKRGHVYVGDAKISFQVVSQPSKEVFDAKLEKFKGYSWSLVTFKDLGRDLFFKAVLLAVVIFHGFLLSLMSKMPVKAKTELSAPKVPDRFARIIVRNPAVRAEDIKKAAAKRTEKEESAGAEAKRNRSEKGREEVRPESQGVLGLLTGSGHTSQASSLTDFLLDKGLAKELEDVMATSQLDLGKGTNDGDVDLDVLIATSELGGGIDDIVDDVSEVEAIQLGEKGRIQVDQIGDVTGTPEAVGQRSEDSVRGILMSYTGRLTYIYNKYLKHNPDLRGKIVVEVEIAANGRVSGVTIISSTLPNEEFVQEILTFIRRWRYEPIDQGTVTVVYPLFFSQVE